jgi:hypothetical protein
MVSDRTDSSTGWQRLGLTGSRCRSQTLPRDRLVAIRRPGHAPLPAWSRPIGGWGSAYAALARGRIDAERLRDLLVGCRPGADPLVFAVDVTTWPRCDAECSPEHGYYYHPFPLRHSAGQPIIAGWAFHWVCQQSFARDSWTASVDVLRLHRWTTPTSRPLVRSALLARLPLAGRRRCLCSTPATTPPSSPSTWGDSRSGAGTAALDRYFYADPPPRSPGSTGRPPISTWTTADPERWGRHNEGWRERRR